jgi:hypothetical protein
VTDRVQLEHDLYVGLEKIVRSDKASKLQGGLRIHSAIYPSAVVVARRLGVQEVEDFVSDWFVECIQTLESAHRAGKFSSRSSTKFPITAYVKRTLVGMGAKFKKMHFEGRPLLEAIYNHVREIDVRPPPPDKIKIRGKWFFSVAGVNCPCGPAPTPPPAPELIEKNYRRIASPLEYKNYIIELVSFLGRKVTLMDVAEHLATPLEDSSPRVYLTDPEDDEASGPSIDSFEDPSEGALRTEVALDSWRALQCLTDDERRRYLLHHQEGREFPEIATIFNDKNPERARTEHRRIERKLQAYVETDDE